MEKKIAYIGFAFVHHKNTHAGYHQIKKYIPYDKIFDVQKFYEKNTEKKNIVGKIASLIIRNFLKFNAIPWFLLNCIVYGWKNPNTIFHFIYGENLFANIKFFLNSRNKIVCTFHQPYEWFVAHPRFMEYLKKIDAIILVSNKEVDKFSAVTKKNNVFYIPHGINTFFYKPEQSIKKDHSLLTVGSWLRDYDFANKVYEKLLEDDSDLQINIVSNPQNKKYIKNNSRIHFHSGISDEELKSLYCRSSILYLPLIRYTANNSLLEAAATGCNIVISSNYADNGYIPEKYITITRMEVEETVRCIQKSFSQCYNYELSEFIRKNYSWENVAKQVVNVIEKI